MNDSIDIRKIRAAQIVPEASHAETPGEDGGIWDFLNKDIQLPGMGGLSDKIKESFYLELNSLLAAGIDIRTALELIAQEQKKKKTKQVFEQLLNRVVRGSTLSQSLQSDSKFTAYEYFSVLIGEETGKLLPVLKELGLFYQKKIKQRRQIIGALTYPIVILVVAFGAVGFMLTYVVPMFSDIFKRFGSELPAITKLVIALSGVMKQSAGLSLILVAGIAGISIWQRKKEWYRFYTSRILLRIPIIGSIIQRIYLARFSNTMALLIGARVPIIQAIQLTKQMLDFYPLEKALSEVEQNVMEGKTLHASLAVYKVFPRKMISMIRVAEEVSQLDIFFGRMADQYNNEVEHQTSILSKFIEPIIIVVLGLLVGVILVAMYLPLFKLGQGF